eukprot:5085752-Pyramimonas_sp.AAC.1
MPLGTARRIPCNTPFALRVPCAVAVRVFCGRRHTGRSIAKRRIEIVVLTRATGTMYIAVERTEVRLQPHIHTTHAMPWG